MALLLRGLLWLSVLGGAAAGIGLPTKNAVQSILNKQEIRKNGGNTESGKNYESYGYGNRGFGDERTTKVENGKGEETISTALKDVRRQGGKQNLGKGLEKGIKGWLDKKNICKNRTSQVSTGSQSDSECFVGNIEFIDNKGETLFGRIPIKDGNELKNVYVRWVKCTDKQDKSNSVGVGSFRKKNRTSSVSTRTQGSESQDWCSKKRNKK